MRNVFVSFRQSDGKEYKDDLCSKFDKNKYVIDYSEDEDLSKYSDVTIQKNLYGKIKRSSITIILLTPDAIDYKRNSQGEIVDWIYKEVNYSLEDRENNKTSGLIAVYVKEAKPYLIKESYHKCTKCDGKKCKEIVYQENLFRKNMMNIKPEYKHNKCNDLYDSDYDSYCSLVPFEEFINDIERYIKIAEEKREKINEYKLTKELQ